MRKQKETDWIINPTLLCQAHWLVAQKAITQPKPTKELANPIARYGRGIKHENTTRNIRKPGDVGKFKFCTFTQNRNALTSWSFEIPASAYCHRWQQPKETKCKHETN